jgi:hypothetical protein
MPQLPGRVELEAAPILLGVDHEHPTGPDHQMIEVGPAARDGQVMQDRPPAPLQRVEQPGGAPLPGRTPSPGDGVGAGPESQTPAGHHGRQPADHQTELGHYQAAEDPTGATDAEDGGDPPGQAPGPDGPLGCPGPPPPGLGGGARPTHRGLHPHRHHRPIGAGASRSSSGSSARWARMACRSAWLSGRTEPLGRSWSSKGRSGTGHRELLPGGASRRPALGLVGHAACEVAVGWCARWRVGGRGCGQRRAAWPGPARWRSGPAAGRPAGFGRPAPGRAPAPDR